MAEVSPNDCRCHPVRRVREAIAKRTTHPAAKVRSVTTPRTLQNLPTNALFVPFVSLWFLPHSAALSGLRCIQHLCPGADAPGYFLPPLAGLLGCRSLLRAVCVFVVLSLTLGTACIPVPVLKIAFADR